MLSRNDQNAEEDKLRWLLMGAGGGVALTIVLVALALILLTGGDGIRLAIDGRNLADAIPLLLHNTLGEQGQLMDLPLASGSQAYWYLARAGGFVAYILLWLATCWGIMMSSKFIKGIISTPAVYSLHEFLPILGVVFAALHALVLLGDEYIDFNIWQLLVPFSSTYEPLWTGLGSLAFYLFLALIASSYLRKQIGQKAWRVFHYTSYLAFLIALLHGVMAGSDSGSPGIRLLYLVTGGISIFLIYYRMLAYAPRQRRSATRRRIAQQQELNNQATQGD